MEPDGFINGSFKAHEWKDGNISIRVGKKAAGRMLDGREWDEYPKARTE